MSGSLTDMIAARYDKFKSYILASFSQLNDYDAEDIIQQTALNLIGCSDEIGSAASYIYASLRNGALNLMRKRRREQLSAAVEYVGQGSSAEDDALANDLKRHMEAALHSVNLL